MAGSTLGSPTVDHAPSAMATVATSLTLPDTPARTSLWLEATRRFRRHQLAMAGLVVLSVMVVAVIVGPLVYRVTINEIDFKAKLKGPTWAPPLGTDDLGQDLL